MDIEGHSLIPKKRFRVNGITYYYRLGKLQACASKRKSRKKKEKKDKDGNIIPYRTANQQANNSKFKNARYLFSYIRKWVLQDLPIWKIAARELNMTDDNLIQSVNYKYLAPDGGIQDIEEFNISTGNLSLPLDMQVSRERLHVTITWDDPRDQQSARPTDQLMAAVLYADEELRDSITMYKETGATRSDKRCVIDLPDQTRGNICIHPFFAREDLTDFSKDKHFMLTGEN